MPRPVWQSSQRSVNAGAASLTAVMPSGIVAGDFLLCYVGNANLDSSISGWDTGWTEHAEVNGGYTNQALGYRWATGTDPNLTLTFSQIGRSCAWVIRFSHVHTTNPIHYHNSNIDDDGGSVIAFPDATTTANNIFVVGAGYSDVDFTTALGGTHPYTSQLDSYSSSTGGSDLTGLLVGGLHPTTGTHDQGWKTLAATANGATTQIVGLKGTDRRIFIT